MGHIMRKADVEVQKLKYAAPNCASIKHLFSLIYPPSGRTSHSSRESPKPCADEVGASDFTQRVGPRRMRQGMQFPRFLSEAVLLSNAFQPTPYRLDRNMNIHTACRLAGGASVLGTEPTTSKNETYAEQIPHLCTEALAGKDEHQPHKQVEYDNALNPTLAPVHRGAESCSSSTSGRRRHGRAWLVAVL